MNHSSDNNDILDAQNSQKKWYPSVQVHIL